MTRERGFALLITLWLLVPLSALFLVLSGTARSDTQLTSNLRSAAQLEAAADGAIETAIFGLLQQRAGRSFTLRLPDADVAVQVLEQSGLINPNAVTPDLLRAVLIRLGAAPEAAERVAAAVADWRTPGQVPRPNGAKAAQYRAAGRLYGPPGAPFETVGELRDVLGMTPRLFAALRPYLTLDTDREPVAALASPLVRAALGDVGVRDRAAQDPGDVFRITATATAGRAAVTRRAAVRMGYSPNRRLWRVLSWETVSGDGAPR